MSTYFKLSNRLQTIASFIPPNAYFADIGSDHAYLPCFVCLQDKTIRAIAGEVKKGPFLHAEETVKKQNLSHRIEVRLGNGLEVINKSDGVNVIVIAGMGASLINNILEAGKEKLSTIERIIVQPNTNASILRKFFLANDFALIQEIILEENNQIYEVLVADKCKDVRKSYIQSESLEKQCMFGPILMKSKSKTFIKKWREEHKKCLHVIQQLKQAKELKTTKLNQLEQQLSWIEEVLS